MQIQLQRSESILLSSENTSAQEESENDCNQGGKLSCYFMVQGASTEQGTTMTSYGGMRTAHRRCLLTRCQMVVCPWADSGWLLLAVSLCGTHIKYRMESKMKWFGGRDHFRFPVNAGNKGDRWKENQTAVGLGAVAYWRAGCTGKERRIFIYT